MKNIEIFENERAAGYNSFTTVWIPLYNEFLNWIPVLLAPVQPKDILVVGCGTGNEIEILVKANKGYQITGVDPSPDMLAQAKVKLAGYHQVTLVESTVNNINVNKKYHAATLLLVLHFLDDEGSKLQLLKQIAKRLVSGAPLIMLDITGNPRQLQDTLQVLKCLVTPYVHEMEIEKRLYRIKNDINAVSEERLAELLQTAGFEKPVRFFQSAIYMGWVAKKV